jgi:hypothetical protein
MIKYVLDVFLMMQITIVKENYNGNGKHRYFHLQKVNIRVSNKDYNYN